MRYIILLMLLMAIMVEAQYTLPYQPESASSSASFTTRIGTEPTPHNPGGGSGASRSATYSYRSVQPPSQQQQTETAATTAPPPIEQPVEARETFREYNPDLKSGQMPASTISMEYEKMPYWFVWMAGIALIFMIILLWRLLRHKQQHL